MTSGWWPTTAVAQHVGQRHLAVSGLEAALHRALDTGLRLAVAHAFSEEIGIATEVLGRRERDRVDPILDHGMACGREPGNPLRERRDETT